MSTPDTVSSSGATGTTTTEDGARRGVSWKVIGLMVIAAIASRFLMIPEGPWEQDEAIFAAGVLDFNVVEHRPHPPGFPGWMLLGKIVYALVGDALLSLRILSGVASGFVGVLIWWLLRTRTGDLLAGLAAVALLMTPSLWVHAPRAFTSTAAVAMLLGAAREWGWSTAVLANDRSDGSPDDPRARRRAIGGWLLLGLAMTVRPQLAPTAAVLALGRLVQSRRILTRELLPMGLGACLIAVIYGWAIVESGGWSAFLAATRAHASDHASVTGSIESFSSLGVTRALGGALPTAAVATLTVLGLGMELRAKPARGLLLAALWLVTLVMVLGAHHPNFPRYSVALVVVSWVPASLALHRLPRGLARVIPTLASVFFATISMTALLAMRAQPLPPVAALRDVARANPPVLAFSHGMFSFARLAKLDGSLGDAIITDVRSPRAPPRLPPGSWALTGRSLRALDGNTVCTREHADFPAEAEALSQRRFTRALAIRDAVLLGDGHHQVERSSNGDSFVWWSDHALLSPPVDAERMTMRLEIPSNHAPVPWRASCEELPLASGVLAAGIQTLSVPIQRCDGPVRIDLPRTFRPEGDGRMLSARLLAAWANGPGLATPSFRFSPGEPATLQTAGVSTRGVYNPERFGERRRGAWTGESATWTFSSGPGELWITLARPPHTPGPVRVQAGAEPMSLEVTAAPARFRVPMRPVNGQVELTLHAPTFVPAERSPTSKDQRALGAIVFEIEIVPDGERVRCP